MEYSVSKENSLSQENLSNNKRPCLRLRNTGKETAHGTDFRVLVSNKDFMEQLWKDIEPQYEEITASEMVGRGKFDLHDFEIRTGRKHKADWFRMLITLPMVQVQRQRILLIKGTSQLILKFLAILQKNPGICLPIYGLEIVKAPSGQIIFSDTIKITKYLMET